MTFLSLIKGDRRCEEALALAIRSHQQQGSDPARSSWLATADAIQLDEAVSRRTEQVAPQVSAPDVENLSAAICCRAAQQSSNDPAQRSDSWQRIERAICRSIGETRLMPHRELRDLRFDDQGGQTQRCRPTAYQRHVLKRIASGRTKASDLS